MLKALILCGGKSTRMYNQDKAFIKVNGSAQYAHLFQLLSELQLDTFLSCNTQQMERIPSNFPKIKDAKGAIGPIGGIYSAMKLYPDADWLVIACDLYLIDKKTIEQLLEVASHPADFITFQKKDSDYFETTISIYKKGLSPLIIQAVEEKQYSLQRVLRSISSHTITPNSEKAITNVNTIEDLDRLQDNGY